MKTKHITLATIAIGATLFFYACGGSGLSKMFVKKWQLESIKSKAMDDQIAMLKAQADTTKDSVTKASLQTNLTMMNTMLEGMKKSTLEYRLDGTFESNMVMMGQTTTDKGTYSLVDGGKKVVVTNEQKKTDTLTIQSVTSDEMIVVGPDGRGSTITITYKAIK